MTAKHACMRRSESLQWHRPGWGRRQTEMRGAGNLWDNYGSVLWGGTPLFTSANNVGFNVSPVNLGR